MSDETAKPKPELKVVSDEQLDEEEAEFRALRRDLPGVKGASAVGIVSISVSKKPPKNEFFRTNKEFKSTVPIIDREEGMETQFYACTEEMVAALAGIGITVTSHALYLIVTEEGAVMIIPVRQPDEDGSQNEYNRTKEGALIRAQTVWLRVYTDLKNKCYRVYEDTSSPSRPDPSWPALKPAKIFRLAFREKGRLIDSPEHPLFQRWASRDKKKDGK